MDIIYLFRTLLKKKWIIIAAGILAASIAYILTLNTPKKYTSSSQISTGFTVSDKIYIGSENFDMFEAETKFSNAIVTMTSPAVISFLSYNLILHDLKEKKPYRTLSEKDKQSPEFKQINIQEAVKTFESKLEKMSLLTSFNPEEKKLLEFLTLYGYDYNSIIKNLSIYRLQRTDYIQVEYSSENPELSAFVVNDLFNEFIRYYRNIRSSISQESIDTLRGIMDKKKLELDYKKALLGGGAIVGEVQSASTFELISNFEREIATEKNTLTSLYASLRKIDQRLGSLGVQTTSIPGNNNDELLILRKAVSDAYAAYLNSGSKDQELLAKYNRLKTEYQSKVADLDPVKPKTTDKPTESKTELLQKKSDIEIDIQTTNVNIGALQTKINNLRNNVYSEAARGASAETLSKEADQANVDYLAAKQKYNDAIDGSSSSVNNFRQVLMGQPAIAADPSKRIILVGMAGLSAAIAAILVIVLLVYLDSSVKTPAIFGKTVNLRLISFVNYMNLKNKSVEEIVAKKDSEGSSFRYRSNIGVFRESLRKLRYEVESSGKKTFLFASTKKGQGKTTLIMGLSHSLSMSNKKILIIDTNFSNNDLTVEMDALPTLEKVKFNLSDPASMIQQVKAAAKELPDKNIFIIGSEGGDYTPSEILPRENILAHLQQLTTEFDYIFLEGPPLNDFSDARELSAYVEGVIGVFSANDMIKQIDKESIGFFKELGQKYVGSVLNMVDLKNVNSV